MAQLHGILFITLAMALFSVEDSLIKAMSALFSQGQLLVMIGLGASGAIGVYARLRGIALFHRRYLHRAFVIRAVMEGLSALTFVTALSKLDLSLTAAIFQATPLATTFAAAVFLREQVGWRRWSAISAGFIGVLIIIRPGMAGFEPAAFWPLLTVMTIVVRDLTTRAIPRDIPSTAIAFYGFSALLVAGGLLLALGGPWVAVTGPALWQWPGAVTMGVVGYFALLAAFRAADVSLIMPFRYTRLIFSMILGMVMFSERPDALTLLGAGIIVASGIYTVLRERRLAHAQ